MLLFASVMRSNRFSAGLYRYTSTGLYLNTGLYRAIIGDSILYYIYYNILYYSNPIITAIISVLFQDNSIILSHDICSVVYCVV